MDTEQTKQLIAVWVRTARNAAKLSGEQLGSRLALELRTKRGHTKGNISHWELGKHEPSLQQLIAISKITGVKLPDELLKALGSVVTQSNDLSMPHRRAADFELVSEIDTDGEVGRIEYWNAKGSCGGGFLNHEQLPKGHLIKEKAFFDKYGIKQANAFAIYADGDSMSEFIVDGDIVIFDRSRIVPISGKIFAIEHPDGLRIKILRREFSGTWVLESKNPDKHQFPDERIPQHQLELLKIHGQFVYRQGG